MLLRVVYARPFYVDRYVYIYAETRSRKALKARLDQVLLWIAGASFFVSQQGKERTLQRGVGPKETKEKARKKVWKKSVALQNSQWASFFLFLSPFSIARKGRFACLIAMGGRGKSSFSLRFCALSPLHYFLSPSSICTAERERTGNASYYWLLPPRNCAAH